MRAIAQKWTIYCTSKVGLGRYAISKDMYVIKVIKIKRNVSDCKLGVSKVNMTCKLGSCRSVMQ